jgi:hypothetical protein
MRRLGNLLFFGVCNGTWTLCVRISAHVATKSFYNLINSVFMKQFIFLLTLILGVGFSAQAAGVATPNYGTNTITIGNTTREASTKKVAMPKKNVFAKIVQWFKKAVKQDILFYVYVLFYVLGLLAPVSIVLGLLSGSLPLIIGGLLSILVCWLIVLLPQAFAKKESE